MNFLTSVQCVLQCEQCSQRSVMWHEQLRIIWYSVVIVTLLPQQPQLVTVSSWGA